MEPEVGGDFLQDLSWLCSIHQSRAWMQPLENREKLLPHKDKKKKEKKSVPISFSLVWSLICRLWFKIRIKSPWGPEPTCSAYPFVQKVTKDNRKRLEPAVPRGPNLPSSSCFFCSSLPFFYPLLLFFCTPPFFTYFFFSLAPLPTFSPRKSLSSCYTAL